IAEAVLNDPVKTVDLSMSQLARRCQVSTTSIVRFYKKVGYSRFRDFLLDIAQEVARERLQYADSARLTHDIARHDTMHDIVDKVVLNETLSIADTAEVLSIDGLE